MSGTHFPVVVRIPVAWGDMDAFQHVNNTVYLRWFQEARIIYFDAGEMAWRDISQKVGPIQATAQIRYLAPVTYPDFVHVRVGVATLGTTSMVMKYTIHSEQRNALVADGETVIVMYDYAKGEKAPIPEEIRAAVLRIEARETDALRVGFNQPERPAGA
mgnify:FL=1|jgi:acyl-CoA thioester hydrolase